MNKMTIATALIASAGAALAGGSHTFDVSGIGVDGGYFDNVGITSLMHDFGSAGKITNISWDLNYESLSPSWQSEMSFSIDTTDGLVLLTLWEAFDDSAISPDSIFGAGSTITVSFIPAPGAAALLGLGGLVATRRRR
jgi:uncharacterized protein (TIGR03382 family)